MAKEFFLMLCQKAGLSKSEREDPKIKMKKFQSTYSLAWLGIWIITQPYDVQNPSACI